MPSKIFVVPDTNAFRGDPMMHGHKFRVLIGEHDRGVKILAIPEVVLRELPRQFREQFESAAIKVQKGANTLRNLGIDLGPLPMPAAQQASQEYEQTLRKRLLAKNVRIPPIPNRKVEEFFDAANARRRPFGLEGKGLKDAVIWRTVLDLAHEGEVILISNDGDFRDEKSLYIHEHLLADLKREGLPADRVRLVDNLDKYLEEHVDGSTQALELARHLLVENQIWASELRESLRQALLSMDISHDPVTISISPNASPDFQYVDEATIEDLDITNAYETGDDDIVSLEVVVRAEIQFTFITSRTEMEWLVSEESDVDFDLYEETFAQGHTGDRYASVQFALDFVVDSHDLGEPEKLHAEDASNLSPTPED
jgi:hypothetical protein